MTDRTTRWLAAGGLLIVGIALDALSDWRLTSALSGLSYGILHALR